MWRKVTCSLYFLVLILNLPIIYFINFYGSDAVKRPNIIVIISDDCGWNDFGIHGSSQIPTPNIDALAYNGITFTKFYTQATCTPSRSAFLTGQYPIRLGMQGTPIVSGENRSLPNNATTMAELLKKLGYDTHLVGKWHLGAAHKNDTPLGRGFDSFFGYWHGFVGYFNYKGYGHALNWNVSGFDLHDDFDPAYSYVGQYATELFTKKSVDIIENHDKQKPLFLVLSHLAAHTGDQGTELGVPNPEEADKKYKYIKDPRRRLYADIVNRLDESIGQVIETLSKNKMLENSIVLFLNDNGGQTVGMYENSASNWPLRGLKFTFLEGGVRGVATLYSPLLKNKGYVNRELFHITDWLPTLYSAAGGNVEDLGSIDGVNQWEVLSQNIRTKRKEILVGINEVAEYSGLISYGGKYKLLNGSYLEEIYDNYYGDSGFIAPPYNVEGILKSPANMAIKKLSKFHKLNRAKISNIRRQLDLSWCKRTENPPSCAHNFCLFDLENDPCESKNLIEIVPEIGDNMKKRLLEFYGELVPQLNIPPDPQSNPIYYNNTWTNWLDF